MHRNYPVNVEVTRIQEDVDDVVVQMDSLEKYLYFFTLNSSLEIMQNFHMYIKDRIQKLYETLGEQINQKYSKTLLKNPILLLYQKLKILTTVLLTYKIE